jgi:hypothetical protein
VIVVEQVYRPPHSFKTCRVSYSNTSLPVRLPEDERVRECIWNKKGEGGGSGFKNGVVGEG